MSWCSASADPDADLAIVSKFYAGVAAVRLFCAAAYTAGFKENPENDGSGSSGSKHTKTLIKH